MKIEGETIRKAADHAQGAGKTLEPALRGVNNVLGEVGTRLVHGMPRKARLVEFKEARFDNAEDWTAAEDGAITVHASVVRGGGWRGSHGHSRRGDLLYRRRGERRTTR